ncbi:hypothetical protein D1816_20515 [Aquimarina sp. AD10]|uniref:hypothetical protein n=1 Tax=Aquimarina sp. AD10 TaxID=1714849 RepID=UPI000E48E7EB|nr:hypothetical protein [Aquimarina sp. AD10]AXT62635.1 hypothetical protein D1816_20515 [Aquimarina sp. AD10]RKM98369.1 hypothetical protein D7033_13140 [Aquimarina sp. AD10]
MSNYLVDHAIYSWNITGTEKCLYKDVKEVVQKMLMENGGVINVNNTALGGDPCPNTPKSFAAIIGIANSEGITRKICTSVEGVNIDVNISGEIIIS